METVKLKTISTLDAICENLENDIFSMRFAPGSKITEADLTSRYGVSRNTVREAIALMLSNGLLEKVANKGVFVRKISPDDLCEIFHLRGLLESEAVRMIISSGNIPIELMQLAEEVERIDPVNDWEKHLEADIEFHETLVQATGSSRLIRLYQSILAEVKLCIFQSHSIVIPKTEKVTQHMQILKAMEEENLEKALILLDKHMESAINSYEAGIKEKGDN